VCVLPKRMLPTTVATPNPVNDVTRTKISNLIPGAFVISVRLRT
jgi:hypothetical protein